MKLLDKNSQFSMVLGKFSKVQGLNALLPLLLVVLFFTLMSDNFFSSYNIMNILRQAAVYAIMGTGMTFVILTGGIDLGQGSVLAFSSVICAMVINATGNMYLGILAALATGALIGILNGVMIAYVRLPAFIMTLGTMYIVRGVTLWITNSTQVNVKGAAAFTFIGQGFLFGIPFPVYIFVIVGACHFGTTFRSEGRKNAYNLIHAFIVVRGSCRSCISCTSHSSPAHSWKWI